MSEVKVNKISPRTACGTVTLGDSGDTITIPAGVTMTNNGTAAGFGATGAASWDTTVKTTGFTAVSGVGYFVNTTAGAITVTLPASPSAGAVVAVSDYAGTSDTNAITIGRNGSNINGAAADLVIEQENSAVTLVYVDGTQGWKATDTSSLSDVELQPTYITATGGTITCSGDFRIHTFTGPGTFCVSTLGNPVGGPSAVDYLVVAGGGGAAIRSAGGGGAGGFRESSGAASGCYTASPLGACVSALPVTVTGYPITVGSGGTGVLVPAGTPANSTPGANSIFSTITSQGGGGSVGHGTPAPTTPTDLSSGAGGSGSGGSAGSGNPGTLLARAGNTPPASPSQGNPGGAAIQDSPWFMGGGGGGATAAGGAGSPTPSISTASAKGGDGATTSISASPTTYGGGGGGGTYTNAPTTVYGPTGGGGSGGGGAGGQFGGPPYPGTGAAGTANTGGGGGGAAYTGSDYNGGNGGSGIVIIRYKFQN